MFGGEIFGTYTQTGMQCQHYGVIMQNNTNSFPTIILNEQNGSLPLFGQTGGLRYGTQINATTGSFTAYLEGEVASGASLELNGTLASVVASATGLPVESLIIYASGANASQIFRVNDVFGEAYSPSIPADWTPVPTTAQAALDQIAARLVAGGL